jgi:hypothetical protein
MNNSEAALRQRIARRHHLIGWWGLLVFLTLGIVLETLHGFKVGAYLDPQHQSRRLMWTLAHAHGTLIALVNIAFAAGLGRFGRFSAAGLRLASFFLVDALLLLPLGFFLGGAWHNETDPWLGVLLVPIGAVLFLAAVALIAVAAIRPPDSPGDGSPGVTAPV